MLKGLGQLGDITNIMKQAQEMQEKLKAAQDEVAEMTAEGEAAGGLVKATVSGKGVVQGLDIDPSILREDSKEIVEDLIVQAISEAQGKASDQAQKRMSEITEGMPLPEGFQMPF